MRQGVEGSATSRPPSAQRVHSNRVGVPSLILSLAGNFATSSVSRFSVFILNIGLTRAATQVSCQPHGELFPVCWTGFFRVFLLFLAKDITFCQDLDGFLLGWVMFKREIGGPLLFWRRFVVEKVLISPDFLGALWVAL